MLGATWLAANATLAGAVGIDRTQDVHAVAVNIERTPPQPWPGYGIYLGQGVVITAAHVPGHWLTNRPKVVVAGQRLETEPLKEGSYPDNDLTVLRIVGPVPPVLADKRVAICDGAPKPGAAVLVSTPEKVVPSSVISPAILPPDLRGKYDASIKDVYTTGNSGSGVFDSETGCLLGIMSSKIEQQVRLIINGAPAVRPVGLAKHFVPAADIKAFLAGLPGF